MITRDWFWQLQASGQGPDWFFYASFAADDAGLLAALVAQQPLPGFARHQAMDGLCARHGHRSAHDVYIDQHNAAALAANLAGVRPQNIWIYHTIEVCGADLTLERGYGGQGYPPGQVAAGSGVAELLAYLQDI